MGALTYQFKEAWISQLNVENQITADRINATLIADDSTVVFDASTGLLAASQLTGTATIDVVGNLAGDTIGYHTGDVQGSVFGDDSTILLDGTTSTLRVGDVVGPALNISNPDQPGDGLNGGTGEVNLNIFSNDNRSLLNLKRKTNTDLTGNTDAIYGTVTFGRDDANGVTTTAIMFGRENSLYFGVAPDGVFNAANKFFVWKDYKLGVGLTSPTEAVDVNGNGKFSGTVTSGGFVQFGSYTDGEIVAVTPANGMVYYNTTDNRFRGYQNGGWINLDDGSAA